MSLMLVAWVKVCHWVLMPITHMVLPTRLSLGWGRGSAPHRRPSRAAGYAKVGAVYTCHRVYVSIQGVHSAPQPPVLPRTATFPKFLCDDRTGPTAPPCPPTPCLKIPHGAALPLERVHCGQAAPPDGSTPEHLPVLRVRFRH